MTGNASKTGDRHDPLAEIVAELPLLMLVGGLLATLLAIACAVGILTIVFAAIFGVPELTIRDTTYDGIWVLVRFGPLLILHGGLLAALAYGLWTGRPWSRRLAVAFWCALIVFTSIAAILHPVGGRFWFFVALCSLPLLLGSWLYLYQWSRAVAYYKSLQADGGHDDLE